MENSEYDMNEHRWSAITLTRTFQKMLLLQNRVYEVKQLLQKTFCMTWEQLA